MIGSRTIHSLAQFLELQPAPNTAVLFGKYGVEDLTLYPQHLMTGILDVLLTLSPSALMLVVAEAIATSGDLRARVSPKTRYDEREQDLKQCLILDGYMVAEKKLVQTDPSLSDSPVEDDLLEALKASGLPHREEIIGKINDSASAFRKAPPDFNAALTNARVALETLARDVAFGIQDRGNAVGSYNPVKWGEMIAFLRNNGEITVEEEKGLAGVFGFLSPGAHRSVGIPEDQMTRLGRSFALNMCWFLLKNYSVR
ncbi:hypothetical protein HBN65_03695 [Pseudomonas lundensis]|uniref:hypothetical protein n=1 Tax=Pseudomonas lundensis TaxID=86185 RepID=UPI0014726DF2|nr:hypothetical protein [Pseudomonas lundensis]NNA05916.1 hypothetical protein [Pseudomonas lundensis]